MLLSYPCYKIWVKEDTVYISVLQATNSLNLSESWISKMEIEAIFTKLLEELNKVPISVYKIFKNVITSKDAESSFDRI